MDTVGKQVRELRERRGWTQVQLGVYAGISPSTVNLIEHGHRNPNAVTLQKIADALEVEPGALFPEATVPKVAAPPSLEPSFNDVLKEEDEERRVYDAVLEAAQASRELRANVKDLIDGEEDLAELQARLLALAAESAVRTQGFRERGVYDFVGRYRGAEVVVNALQAGVDPAELFPTELFGVPPEAEVRVHEDLLQKTPDNVKDAIATMRAERDAIGELLSGLKVAEQARKQFEGVLVAA